MPEPNERVDVAGNPVPVDAATIPKPPGVGQTQVEERPGSEVPIHLPVEVIVKRCFGYGSSSCERLLKKLTVEQKKAIPEAYAMAIKTGRPADRKRLLELLTPGDG